MKKFIALFLICLPLIAVAQTDNKYLEGAVPVNNDKVEFSTELQVPAMTKQQIYDTMLDWANNKFQPKDKFNARVLYTNPQDGSIAVGGEEYMVFSSSALSLDRTRIYYLLSIVCDNGKCQIDMNRIRYWYNEARDGGEKYTAEEWITDEMALNKAKTKLAPVCGKFRKKTIDLKDELFAEMRSALGNKMIELGLQAAPVKPAEQVAVVQPSVQPAPVVPVTVAPVQQSAVQETKAVTEEDKIAQAVRMTISVNGEELEIDKDCWGGRSQLFGKDVTYCIIDTQKTMSNILMSQSDNYRISFYPNGSNQPCVVIECKKMMMQNVKGEEAKKMNPSCNPDKSYNVYVGEVK